MIGAAALVPPKTRKPPSWKLSNTVTPGAGSATADTSAVVLRGQPLSCCQGGFGENLEQPEPAPFHAVSVQPRALFARRSEVPPTAVTNREAAGWITPTPSSPLLAVMTTPGLLRCCWSNVSWPADSEPPQLFEMYRAPIRAAVSIAVNSELSGPFGSTRRIL